MKKIKYLFLITLVSFFFLPTISNAMPAPRTAKTFYFSTIESLQDNKNKLTVYLKQSCFKYDKDRCEEENEKKEIDSLFMGSGYSRDKFTTIGSFSAIPQLSIIYKKDNWEYYEDDNENQFLKSKNFDKEIFLHGDYYEGTRFVNLDIIIKEFNTNDYSEVEIKDYEKYENFIFVFGNHSEEGYDYYFTITPFPIVLKAKNITENDKNEFKEIVSSLKMSKQLMGEMTYNTFIYPQGSYPRLFTGLKDLVSWGKIHGKTTVQKNSINQNKNCIFKWPTYLDTLDQQECRQIGLVGERETMCTYPVVLKDENIKVSEASSNQANDNYLDFYRCSQLPLLFYSRSLKETMIDKDNKKLENILITLDRYQKELTGKNINLKEKVNSDIKVYTAHEQLNVSDVKETTTTNYGAIIFNISDLDSKKFFKYEVEDEKKYLYPYFRLYIIKLSDQNLSLSKDLEYKYFNHWVYLGQTGNNLVVVEYIPDKNDKLNKEMMIFFFHRIRDLKFLDEDFEPFGGCAYNDGLKCRDSNIDTSFFYSVISVYNSHSLKYTYDGFDRLTENDFLWEGDKNISFEYEEFPQKIPDYVYEIITKQFDNKINYKDSKLSLVGVNYSCEKNKKICIDKGDGWDYMHNNSNYQKSNFSDNFELLKNLNPIWYIIILICVFVVPATFLIYFIIKVLINIIKIIKRN